jgi:hypothetical protein
MSLGPYRSPPPYVVCESRAVPLSTGFPRITHVTSLPPVPGIGGFVQAPPGTRDARITLCSRGAGTSVSIAEADLELGVLLGRAPKCLDGGLHAVLNPGISRAHLLILRDPEGSVTAFDLCSVQGTYFYGARIRACRLTGGATRLELGAYEPVTLLWQGPMLH